MFNSFDSGALKHKTCFICYLLSELDCIYCKNSFDIGCIKMHKKYMLSLSNVIFILIISYC